MSAFPALLRDYLRYPDVQANVSSVNALQTISHAEIHSFKKTNRELFDLLDLDLTGALSHLYKHRHFRTIGLFVTLLLQDINLMDYCKASSVKGAAGESGARIAAMVRQAIHAQNTRQGRLPIWASGLIGGLIGIVILLLLLIAILAYVTSKL